MRKTYLSDTVVLALGVVGLIGVVCWRVDAQATTLYSSIKYPGEQRRNCITFIDKNPPKYRPCDLNYGSLYAGDELDWFQSSTAPGNRSVIKDLGAHTWSETPAIPVVVPLPKLKPGERRNVTVDTSGADGAPGKPGTNGVPGTNDVPETNAESGLPDNRVTDGAGRISRGASNQPDQPPLARDSDPRKQRSKQDGKPKIDPVFVKAVPGHMYVIHVVDDDSDFYALFRVEELLRGDSVLVSWKLVDTPPVSDK